MEAFTPIYTKVGVTQTCFFKDSTHNNYFYLFIYFKLNKLCKPCSVVQYLFIIYLFIIIFLKFCN